MFKRKELAIAIDNSEEFYTLMDILNDNGYYGIDHWNDKELSPREYIVKDNREWDYLFCASDKKYHLDKCKEGYLKNGFLYAKTIHASDIKDLSSDMYDIDAGIYFYI